MKVWPKLGVRLFWFVYVKVGFARRVSLGTLQLVAWGESFVRDFGQATFGDLMSVYLISPSARARRTFITL